MKAFFQKIKIFMKISILLLTNDSIRDILVINLVHI